MCENAKRGNSMLEKINGVKDLKNIDLRQKEQLAEEIRSRIEKSLSRFDDAGKECDVYLEYHGQLRH